MYDSLSAKNADIGVAKKCGIVIAKVAFCITNTPTTLNVGDYDNTKTRIYNLSIYGIL